MIVLPAIDIRGGKCVRLRQGIFDEETVYYQDPVEVARMWEEKGAEYLHIVDLDGAQRGVRSNYSIIKSIVENIDVPIEVGGGIRSLETIESYLNIGISRVILGTKAVENIDFVKESCDLYGEKIAVSVDGKGNYAAIKGWIETSNKAIIPFCKDIERLGVSTIIYTDISKDGMLSGPNLGMLKALNSTLNANIIASGGISTIEDIKSLLELNLYGAITGKALYEGNLTMEEITSLFKKGGK